MERSGATAFRFTKPTRLWDSFDWAQFWNEHVTVRDQNFELYPPPSIEFNRRIIIGVYWDYLYAGCRVINRIEAIEGIYDAGDRIVVGIGPVPDLGSCQTMVLPTQVVSIPRLDKSVEFTGKVPEQRYEPLPDSQRIPSNFPAINLPRIENPAPAETQARSPAPGREPPGEDGQVGTNHRPIQTKSNRVHRS